VPGNKSPGHSLTPKEARAVHYSALELEEAIWQHASTPIQEHLRELNGGGAQAPLYVYMRSNQCRDMRETN